MIPDRKRWLAWTLPSKASYAGFWIGAIGLVISVLSIGLAVYFYANPVASAPTASDEFVRRTHPVQLRVSNVEIMRWLGDEEDAITVTLVNDATVPVDGIEVDIGDGTTHLPRFTSQEFKASAGSLSIAAGSETKVPIAGTQTRPSCCRRPPAIGSPPGTCACGTYGRAGWPSCQSGNVT